MKKLFALLLALTMIFTIAACGGNGTTPSGGKAWPAADYMPDGVAYAGGGEIVVVVADMGGTPGSDFVYVNGVTKKDFDAYVAQLESAGIAGDVTELDGGSYTYGGEKDSFYVNLSYYGDTPQTTMDKVNGKIVDVEYNLHISLGINQLKQQG